MDADHEIKMKNNKFIKREVKKQVEKQAYYHIMEEEDFLISATTGKEDNKNKKKNSLGSFSNTNSCGSSGKKGSNGVGGGGEGGGGGASSMKCCQADRCTADLSDAKQYHRRHKVCEHHAKAQSVVVGGIRQRFCQQCSRFHEVSEFDETKRSCRRRLAGHNERRRKNSTDSSHTNATTDQSSSRKGTTVAAAGGIDAQVKEIVCGQAADHDRAPMQISIQENPAYKHLQIR